MRSTSSVVTLIAVLLVALAAKLERTIVATATDQPAISTTETEQQPTASIALGRG